MTSLNIPVSGPRELRQRLEEFRDGYPGAVLKALELQSWAIMRESFKEVPVDTGLLRESGYVQDPEVVDGQASVTFGYATEYAFFVHETPPAAAPSESHLAKLFGRAKKMRGKKIGPTRKAARMAYLDELSQTPRESGYAGGGAWHQPPTKWKYLEDPVMRHAQEFPRKVLRRTLMILTTAREGAWSQGQTFTTEG